MKKHITPKQTTLKTITLISFCLLNMSCGAEKNSTQDTPKNDIVENEVTTQTEPTKEVTTQTDSKQPITDNINDANLQAENSQEIYYITMSFEEFFEYFPSNLKASNSLLIRSLVFHRQQNPVF